MATYQSVTDAIDALAEEIHYGEECASETYAEAGMGAVASGYSDPCAWGNEAVQGINAQLSRDRAKLAELKALRDAHPEHVVEVESVVLWDEKYGLEAEVDLPF